MIHLTKPPNKLRQALPEPCLQNTKVYFNNPKTLKKQSLHIDNYINRTHKYQSSLCFKYIKNDLKHRNMIIYLAIAESCPSSSFTFMSLARAKTAYIDIYTYTLNTSILRNKFILASGKLFIDLKLKGNLILKRHRGYRR